MSAASLQTLSLQAVTLDAGAMRHGADALGADSPARLLRHRTFHTIDALRGIAAIAVVLFHASFIYGVTRPAEGQVAVDLFFVMSGFIIASRYDDDLNAGMGLRAFLGIRLIRLYPLFLLGTLLALVPALIAIESGRGTALHWGDVYAFPLAVFMLPSRAAMPSVSSLYPLNYVSWSLALEIVVNVAYAATFRAWTIRGVAILLGLSFIGLCLCEVFYGSLGAGFDWDNALGGIPRILYGFGAGVMICRFRGRLPFAGRVPWWALLLLVIAIFVFDAAWFDANWAKPIWELFLVGVLVPAIVVAAIGNEPPKMLQGACALSGLLSYGVYSLHAPFLGLFLRGETMMHLDLDAFSLGKAFVFTGLLLVVCGVAHIAYDKPIRRSLTRRLKDPGRSKKLRLFA